MYNTQVYLIFTTEILLLNAYLITNVSNQIEQNEFILKSHVTALNLVSEFTKEGKNLVIIQCNILDADDKICKYFHKSLKITFQILR